jgi:type IV pilus biogenesis protein CpaD/CtpE
MRIAIAAVATLGLAGCGEPRSACDNDSMAFVMSQNFVKRDLRAPSTAKFPMTTAPGVSVTKMPNCRFRVRSYVDAQNGFGAQIRTNYVAVLQAQEGTQNYRLESLETF